MDSDIVEEKKEGGGELNITSVCVRGGGGGIDPLQAWVGGMLASDL